MQEFPDFILGLPELDAPFEGVSGRLLQGESQQVAFVHFERDSVVPKHTHRAQWELVIAGEVELEMEGEKLVHRAGDGFFIPAGVEHGASAKAGYRAVVFFDQADRYQAK